MVMKKGAVQSGTSHIPIEGELAQTLLTVLRSINGTAVTSRKELPTEAANAVRAFRAISCALATLSDQFTCGTAPATDVAER